MSPGRSSRAASIAFCTATRVATLVVGSNVGAAELQAALLDGFHIRCHRSSARASAACCSSLAATPRARACSRSAVTTSASTQNGSSGMPITRLVAVMCAAPNGFPCASGASVKSGEGKPMCERRTRSVGDPRCRRAATNARSRALRSSATSPNWTTFQPYARKRPSTSSLQVSDVVPSMVIRLSSNTQMSRSSCWWPANDAAS